MNLSVGKNIRLFKNSSIEKLTYVHPLMPVVLWVPISVYMFFGSYLNGELSFSISALFYFCGFLVWTPIEYLMHRFVFHFKPRGLFQERLLFLMHGVHHEDPEDQRRLLMPPLAAILLASLFYILFILFLGSVIARPFFGGFLIGYLIYDYIHFMSHFSRPKSKHLKYLKQKHMRHHFACPNQLYGVSNTFWDKVFGTYQ